MNCEVASEVRGRCNARSSVQGKVTTRLNEWFVGDCGRSESLATKLAPCGHEIIVTVGDETSSVTGHCVCSGETFAAPIAVGGKGFGLKTKTKTDTITEFVSGEVRTVEEGWHCGEPGTGGLGSFNAPLGERGGRVKDSCQSVLIGFSKPVFGR
jgi:hypothetical protein